MVKLNFKNLNLGLNRALKEINKYAPNAKKEDILIDLDNKTIVLSFENEDIEIKMELYVFEGEFIVVYKSFNK